MRDGEAWDADTDLYLFQRFLIPHDDAGDRLGRTAVITVRNRPHVLKMLCYQVHEAVVIDVTGRCDNQVPRIETLAVCVKDDLLLKLPNCLFCSQNRLAKRVILPEILGKDFVNQVVGIVLVHLDFFEDDTTLAADVLDVEGRIEHQVTKHVHGDGQMLVKDLDIEADTLLGGEGVHVSTDGIDLAGYVLGTAMLGAFEDHVLNEMGDTIPLGVFVTGASLDPNAHRNGADVLHLLCDHRQAIGQDLAADMSDVFYHCCLPTGPCVIYQLAHQDYLGHIPLLF